MKISYTRKDYSRLVNLINKNSSLLLIGTEAPIIHLIDSCKNKKEIELIFMLLENLVLIDTPRTNSLLNTLVEYFSDISRNPEIVQLSAITIDSSPDSGQWIIQAIKSKIPENLSDNIVLSNDFNKTVQYFNKGRSVVIVLDEFLGSGKTVRNRVKTFFERTRAEKCQVDLHFLFLAGMERTIQTLKDDGINVFCALPLKRGISDNFKGKKIDVNISLMKELESRLAPEIKNKRLEDYSLGYGRAEALFSSEFASGNTPNSVFPIFWWKLDNKKNKRLNLLNRYENGF